MGAWITSQLNVALMRKLRGSLMCLAFFPLPMGVYTNEHVADVRSTGAGIKCMYCIAQWPGF